MSWATHSLCTTLVMFGSLSLVYFLNLPHKGIVDMMDQKKRIAEKRGEIEEWIEQVDFAGELSVFLPRDQQAIIKDFRRSIRSELDRQLAILE